MTDIAPTKYFAKHVLTHWEDYEWSLQGFGMLRAYLTADRVTRFHIWNNQFKTPGVSTMHNHPWDLHSTVCAGEMLNTRFTYWDRVPGATQRGTAGAYHRAKIIPGAEAEIVSEKISVVLQASDVETYREGDTYYQTKDEIHDSDPLPGTVTMVDRTFHPDRPDRAYVFWPVGTKWGNAKPRPATRLEIMAIVNHSLAKWF